MVVEIAGVVKDIPVPAETPPVEVAYQLIAPADGVAPIVTVPAPQRAAGEVAVMVGIALTVTATAVLELLTQPACTVSA